MAFDLLVKPQIKLLEIPSQRCVELVYEELIKICHTCGSTELSRYPRLQAKLIEVVSDLLRERLGPASSYVESLISIQRAYINTNHPNFLGAAAAMSHVVTARQERERKRLVQEERDRREKKRAKELVANGTEALEEEEDAAHEKGDPSHSRKHLHQGSRSMSPAVRENGTGSIMATMNGVRSNSPNRFNSQSVGNARDSFLTYFFGKDGMNQPSGAGAPSSLPRHVSQGTEPSFSQSIRRVEDKLPYRPNPPLIRDEESPKAAGFGLGSQMVMCPPIITPLYQF
jgi:dynamin 1-like protein